MALGYFILLWGIQLTVRMGWGFESMQTLHMHYLPILALYYDGNEGSTHTRNESGGRKCEPSQQFSVSQVDE